ncbi:MAG: DUF2231 domain-containing protein [Nitrospirae bacterium]|nr:DUF2231 domain-containing protein [Candidatus Troglogloeales bacterium]
MIEETSLMMKTLFPGLVALPNLHPLFVHFPIALFLSALGMEALAVALRREKCHTVATWMLYLGTASALLTVLTGLGAEFSLAALHAQGHDAPGHDYIHIHRRWMITTTLFGVGLSCYLYWINTKEKWSTHRWVLLIGFLMLAMLTALGADRGARLVYEFGTGVNPDIIKTGHIEKQSTTGYTQGGEEAHTPGAPASSSTPGTDASTPHPHDNSDTGTNPIRPGEQGGREGE